MPSLGADMDAGTVTRWLVHPGDAVRRGQIVAIVETDKADVEVEVFDDGVIEDLLVPEGVRVDVGTPLAQIGAPSSAPPKHAGDTPPPRRPRKAATRAKRARGDRRRRGADALGRAADPASPGTLCSDAAVRGPAPETGVAPRAPTRRTGGGRPLRGVPAAGWSPREPARPTARYGPRT